jgi:hypothetical protein
VVTLNFGGSRIFFTASGLGINWQSVPNSANVNQFASPIGLANGGVFLRMAHP